MIRRIGARLAGAGVLLLLLWPLLQTVWLSFAPGELLETSETGFSLRWYGEFLHDPRWVGALANSLLVGALAASLASVTGTSLAIAVARHHFRGGHVLAGAVLLPLFVPGVVLGLSLLPLVHAGGLSASPMILAFVHAAVSQPIVFLMVRSALDSADPCLEQAARGLGATPWQAFRRVTLPLIRSGVLAGAITAFLLSLNEAVIAQFLTTSQTETLPRLIWPKLRYTLSPIVAAASCISVSVTFVGLLIITWMFRPRKRRFSFFP